VSDGRISPHHAEELAGCFAAHARELFGYACVLARGDKTLADDLVQAAFEAAGLTWGVVRELADEQRRVWLRRTLANIAASGFRREAALRDRLPRIEVRYRKSHTDPPEQAFSSIALERCWQIIKAMPERQHAVAVLRWQLDMKEAEIAAILQMAPNTVSAHLHKARRRLIAQLGPDQPFLPDGPQGAPS
jgi:RNA polymerase sigma factor (sigma-70 family)